MEVLKVVNDVSHRFGLWFLSSSDVLLLISPPLFYTGFMGMGFTFLKLPTFRKLLIKVWVMHELFFFFFNLWFAKKVVLSFKCNFIPICIFSILSKWLGNPPDKSFLSMLIFTDP